MFHQLLRDSRLPPACVPDRAGRLIVAALAPHRVGGAVTVDRQAEVVAEREAESARQNVVVAGGVLREPGFAAPTRTTVGRTAVICIPEPPRGMTRFRH